MTLLHYVLATLAAVAAGAINAIAGGGTLVTFPTLTALGIPAITANVTNTVALSPGYLSATLAQAKDLRGQRSRLWTCIPSSILGGIAGGLLLLWTEERTFRQLVPFLILLASLLLALQSPVRAWLTRSRSRSEGGTTASLPSAEIAGSASASPHPLVRSIPLILAVAVAAAYGGYFGAGLSVIVLAVLGLLIDDSLTRLNALKQAIAFAVNVAAAIFFVFSGRVLWPVAIAMALGAWVGGAIGGRIAGRIQPSVLRWTVVVIGTIVGVIYLVR
ncbi:MAG: sulfite exporter TauE/SafE family protein [Candidatus Eisenbacteria bacterium]|uniref:Probable membrane transporter protein n=1 Tax=Eiseniibacteriota bacterium TaxID=2212470 RepID=A0A956NCY3_UNCEI|nr:sulfite exporter TauE/SafE family protein [Candidatus Eisenbacteria bacterium]